MAREGAASKWAAREDNSPGCGEVNEPSTSARHANADAVGNVKRQIRKEEDDQRHAEKESKKPGCAAGPNVRVATKQARHLARIAQGGNNKCNQRSLDALHRPA